MKQIKFKLKNDKYRKARAGYSRLLHIYCSRCNSYLLSYQKDGSGSLKRLYSDRIFTPEIPKNTKELICKICKTVIGTSYIYEKEKRPSFRLCQNVVFKKLGKNIKK